MYTILIIGGLLLILMLFRSWYEVRYFRVKHYICNNKKVKHPVRIAYLSDLHSCSYGRNNQALAEAVRNMKPDCIVIGGDLIIGKEKKVRTKEALEFLKQLDGSCPVLYTFGNHETRVADMEEFQEYLKEIEKYPVTLLNNRSFELEVHGTKLCFYGLELKNDIYKKHQAFQWNHPVFSKKEEAVCILNAHDPKYFPEYAKSGADYVLSGHNHGGIVQLPFVNGVISTEYHLFPEYSYGIYRQGNSTMILSGGAGTHTIKFRLFNQTEVLQLDFVPEQ